MTNPNDPTYPVKAWDGSAQEAVTPRGLTKREEFAKAAMQGLLGNVEIVVEMAKVAGSDVALAARSISYLALVHADALIAELNKEFK